MIVYNEKDFIQKIKRLRDGMLNRCYSKQSSSYNRYGGKGVSVCQRWIDSFDDFLSDIIELDGFSYYGVMSGKLQLDKDKYQQGAKNKIYSPETCCFLSPQENSEFRDTTKKFFVVTPEGKLSQHVNLEKYCKQHGIQSKNAYRILKGNTTRTNVSGYQFFNHLPSNNEILPPRIYKAVNPNGRMFFFFRCDYLEEFGFDSNYIRRYIKSGKTDKDGWRFMIHQDGYIVKRKQEERWYDNCN